MRVMDTQTFIKERLGGPANVARICGIKPPSVCGWKKFPAEHCSTLEREIGVMRWELRPHDWSRIWPELLVHPDAPKVAGSATAD